jgi:hypothetical protein
MSEAEGRPAEAGDEPSLDEVKKYVDAVDKVMAHENTRVAWLMGFLTGSALTSDSDEPESAIERLDDLDIDLTVMERRQERNRPFPGTA